MVTHDRQLVEKHLSKLQKLNYSMFRWWRNYQVPKPLSKNKLMIERIKNGDFDQSPYFWMAQMALWEKHDNDNDKSLEPYEQRKRGSMLLSKYERLMDDYKKDEDERIETFINDSCKSMGFDKEDFKYEFESYQGTIEEFYNKKRQEWLEKKQVTPVN
jgi:hypothetical protein